MHFVIFGLCLKTLFLKRLGNTIRVSNILDPDQAQHFARHDLGQNYFQMLPADDNSCHHLQVKSCDLKITLC